MTEFAINRCLRLLAQDRRVFASKLLPIRTADLPPNCETEFWDDQMLTHRQMSQMAPETT
ncbi:hypothetical protein WJ12_20895 [Burkholderia seminalis]|nr:hypothetical protein WJ12_20895 [Burkholderia seminalis]